MNYIIATLQAPQTGGFAEKLKDMLWTAYGPLVKAALVVALVVIVVIPIVGFLKKIMR